MIHGASNWETQARTVEMYAKGVACSEKISKAEKKGLAEECMIRFKSLGPQAKENAKRYLARHLTASALKILKSWKLVTNKDAQGNDSAVRDEGYIAGWKVRAELFHAFVRGTEKDGVDELEHERVAENYTAAISGMNIQERRLFENYLFNEATINPTVRDKLASYLDARNLRGYRANAIDFIATFRLTTQNLLGEVQVPSDSDDEVALLYKLAVKKLSPQDRIAFDTFVFDAEGGLPRKVSKGLCEYLEKQGVDFPGGFVKELFAD